MLAKSVYQADECLNGLTFYFLLFLLLFLEVGRTKRRRLGSPLIGRRLDAPEAERRNALICSHYALWILKKNESLFHNQIQY